MALGIDLLDHRAVGHGEHQAAPILVADDKEVVVCRIVEVHDFPAEEAVVAFDSVADKVFGVKAFLVIFLIFAVLLTLAVGRLEAADIVAEGVKRGRAELRGLGLGCYAVDCQQRCLGAFGAQARTMRPTWGPFP